MSEYCECNEEMSLMMKYRGDNEEIRIFKCRFCNKEKMVRAFYLRSNRAGLCRDCFFLSNHDTAVGDGYCTMLKLVMKETDSCEKWVRK